MTREKIRILSIDGGGIRGIIPAYTLIKIEEKLKDLSGNRDARIADYFDLFVGTSTGAILAAILLIPDHNGRPKYTAVDAYNLYMKNGDFIFNQSKRFGGVIRQAFFNGALYDHTNLEKALAKHAGETLLSELIRPCMMTAYNMKRKSSFFFRSHENKEKTGDFRLTDALRSTSAAPTYFSPAKISSLHPEKPAEMVNLDGGVFANNPAMCAYAEARGIKFPDWFDGEVEDKIFPTAKNMMMLSLGTGGGHLDLDNPARADKWKLIKWAKKSPNIMMDGALDTVNFQMKMMYGSLSDPEDVKDFKRVDFTLKENEKLPYSPDMANASETNLKKLAEAGAATYEQANSSGDDERSLDDFISRIVDIQNKLDEGTGKDILG